MKIFKLVKTIASKDGKLHFKRFAILETRYFAVYIHRIYESDKDEHLHSHPWNFCGVILKGSYVERYRNRYFNGSSVETRTLKPFMTLRGDQRYYHKIDRIVSGPVTTLFIVGRRSPKWYYWVDGKFVEHQDYRGMKNSSPM